MGSTPDAAPDVLTILGSPNGDSIHFGVAGINLNAGTDAGVDVSLVFNRAHGPYGYQTGQVYLAQQDDERWQLVGDPIEDLADLGRELKATGANNAGPRNVPQLSETEALSGTRCLGVMRHM